MLLVLSLLTACDPDCGGDDVCRVADGTYQAQAPDGWKTAGPLPVAFHFYGYQGSPEKSFNDNRALTDFSDAGVLYVVPQDVDGWEFDGVDTQGIVGRRDDSAFLDQVLDDLDERWGIDRDRLFLTGHSVGGSAVHDMACLEPGIWAAAAPFSGVFWEPIPDACVTRAIPLRHTHGTSDETWPWEGRSFGDHARQGNVDEALDFWIGERACGPDAASTAVSVSSCQTWTGCAGGADIALCAHDGGHGKPSDWAATTMAWMLDL